MRSILLFMGSGHLLPQWNNTSITLVPKVKTPTTVKEYRPIACCTVVYKLISKILTARLAKVVGMVVHEAQAGFIPGKHIADNTLLATEPLSSCLRLIICKITYESLNVSF